jgi:hypothetical protein
MVKQTKQPAYDYSVLNNHVFKSSNRQMRSERMFHQCYAPGSWLQQLIKVDEIEKNTN